MAGTYEEAKMVDPKTLEATDPDTDDTILDIEGTITILDKDAKAFVDELEALFEKYANDDSWHFKFG